MLPNPLRNCISTASLDSSMFLEGIKIMTGQTWTCADVLFSGHTVNLTLDALMFYRYSHVVPLFRSDRLKQLFELTHCTPVKLIGALAADDFQTLTCCYVLQRGCTSSLDTL